MAYIDQIKKAAIAAALKQVVPAGWKYSLAVRHYSTIIMTISAAPVDLLRTIKPSAYFDPATATHTEINQYRVAAAFDDECVAEVFQAIFQALNTGNYDKSDTQTDYFDVGHYVRLDIGRWDRPFLFTGYPALNNSMSKKPRPGRRRARIGSSH